MSQPRNKLQRVVNWQESAASVVARIVQPWERCLKVGDQLPTEDSLIARFEVSRITVRRAIQNLVSRGLVEIRRGKGTFVTAPKITHDLTELSGFVEDMHALGRKPTARVISKKIVTADTTVASHLALT